MEHKGIFNLKIIKESWLLLIADLLLFLLLNSSKTFAQGGNANFSETWAFNESKSNFGEGGFRMGATKLTIIQEGNNMYVERTIVRQSGE